MAGAGIWHAVTHASYGAARSDEFANRSPAGYTRSGSRHFGFPKMGVAGLALFTRLG